MDKSSGVFASKYRLDRRSRRLIRKVIHIVVLLVTFGQLVAAQAKRPQTPEDIVGINRASDVQITPDGKRMVYVMTSWDRERDRYNSDLWMTTDARENHRLTGDPSRDDHPRWSPDATRIAFLSERSGDAPAGAQIYLLNSAIGGEPLRLTRHGAPIQRFEWSFDGRYIAFIAAVAEPVRPESTPRQSGLPAGLVPVLPPVLVDSVDRPHQLWIVEVQTGVIQPLTTGTQHLVSFGWSADGSRIVFAARPSSRLLDAPQSEIFLIGDLRQSGLSDQKPPKQEAEPNDPAGRPAHWQLSPRDSSAARRLTRGNGAESEPRFSPDGRWISYLAKSDGDPLTGPDRLHIIPSKGTGRTANGNDGRAPLVLPRNFDGYIRTYRWVYDSDRIIFNAGLGVNQQIFSVSRDEPTAQALTRSEGYDSSFSITPDAQTIAFIHENPRTPSEVAYLSARIMVPIFLTDLNPVSRELALGQVETIRWRAKDGTSIEGLLVYPVGFETGHRYPLVTSLHGGPEGAYTRGFEANWGSFPQIYAARGYALFLPNFRGSSNYGAKFAQSNAKLAGRIDVDDVLSGIDHLIKIGIADETRLGLVGWSYGGYLSGLLIGQSTRFRAAAWGAGLSNATSYWGTADMVSSRERLHGGTPWEVPKLYEAISPLTNFHKVQTPSLIFHGEKDERVPLTQSQESYRRLRRLGVNVVMVVYPGQGHALEVPSYQVDKMKRELEWIEKYLQPIRKSNQER